MGHLITNPFLFFVCRLVYVVLGPYHEHIGLLTAMEDRRLFDRGNGYYLVLVAASCNEVA